MARIVEFAGLPGSGKTTISLLLASEPNSDSSELSLTVAPVGRLARHKRRRLQVRAAYRYRACLWRSIRILKRSDRPVQQRMLAFRLLLVSLSEYVFAEELARDKLIALDEGVVQRCFMLFIERSGITLSLDAIRSFIETLPAPEFVILLSVNPELAMERLETRSRGLPKRFEALSHDERCEILDAGYALLAGVVERFETERRTETMVLVDNLRPDKAAALIRSELIQRKATWA